MPADLPEHQEQQLELLEDEVFDFDDVIRQQLSQEPAAKDVASAAATHPRLGISEAASQEARDTREMIASMLDQQPLMSVDTTPPAYLEYLRIIFSCARLLRQPAMPPDLRQSVTTLLAKAKSLFCANAFSLVAHTVNAISGRSPQLPAFWGDTFSQHECLLWIELMETVFYFWSDPDPCGLRERRQDDIVVEAFAVGLLDRLGDLRAAYSRPAEVAAAVAEAPGESGSSQAEQLARGIRRRLRPGHLLLLARVKKADKSLTPVLAAFDCFLEAAGALPAAPAAAGPTLSRTRAALNGVTFEQALAALRLHRPRQFGASLPRLRRLRQRHLCRPELRQPPRQLRDLLSAAAASLGDPELPEILAAYVEYAVAASEFELRWQRSTVRDAAAIGPFLLGRLSSMVAKNIARAKSAGCWGSLSDELQADLQHQSERSLSALTTAGPAGSGSDAPERDRNGIVTFELDFVASRSPGFRPEFLLPGQAPTAPTLT